MKFIKPFFSFLEIYLNKTLVLPSIYLFVYKNIIRKEIKLANINSKDNILNIGCGALPFTAILINKFTSANVTAIDFDKKAVTSAKSLIKKFKLENKINVIYGDGNNFSTNDFSVILIALHAFDKNKIFENILKNNKDNTRVVFRLPRKFFVKEYQTLSDKYKYTSKVKHFMLTFNKSVLFLLNRENRENRVNQVNQG